MALLALLAALAGVMSLSWLDSQQPSQISNINAPGSYASASARQQHWAKSLGIPATLTNSLGMRFVLIPPDDGDGSRAVHEPFYCGVHEVTVAQYRQFLSATGASSRPADASHTWQADRHPAIDLTAADAEMFCLWLSQRDRANYRLPTDTELAHACRAGAGDRFWFDAGRVDVGRFAWHDATASRRTHQVGLLEANPFGLHDILGNAPEWCRAAQGKSTAGSAEYRLFGGSWSSPANELGAVQAAGTIGGLRLVLEIPTEARWDRKSVAGAEAGRIR